MTARPRGSPAGFHLCGEKGRRRAWARVSQQHFLAGGRGEQASGRGRAGDATDGVCGEVVALPAHCGSQAEHPFRARQTWKGLSMSREGNGAGAQGVAEGAEGAQAARRLGDYLLTLHNSLTGGWSQVEVCLCSPGTSNRTGGKGLWLCYRRFRLDVLENFPKGVQL